MAYKHGIYISEVPTSVTPPVQAAAGLPVVVGTAPINLASTQEYVNKPFLAYTYQEAVQALGYSSNWEQYTLCEFMKSHFALFSVAPVIFINVLDPATHKTAVPESSVGMASGVATIAAQGVLLPSLKVALTSGGTDLVKDTDYTAAFDSDGKVIITRIATGTIPSNATEIFVEYNKLNPSAVEEDDIIGGVNGVTGAYTGLELINKVFPLFRLVPGQVLAPGWSQNPTVAAVMKAKAGSINSLFKAMAVTDIDDTVTGADLYTEAPAWKNTNNYTDPLQIVCWPRVKLGEDVYHLSTQVAGLLCKLDGQNDDLPYLSPSNKSLQCNGALVKSSGAEVSLDPAQANYLNGEGIVTALNFIGGWRLWGNRTAAYPGNTDVKDAYIPVRRMFNWVGNTIILTFWQKVDDPTNKRLIDTVVDSINIWLNGLTARGALLGGRVEFYQDDNPTTDLLNGIVRFRVYLTPPTPAEDMEFVLEFDVNYLTALFAA